MSLRDAKEALANTIANELLKGREDAVPTSIILVSYIEMLIEELLLENKEANPQGPSSEGES
jgi:hypothetical protein